VCVCVRMCASAFGWCDGLFLILIKFINFSYAIKYPKKDRIFFCISGHVIIWNKLKQFIFVKPDRMYEINGNCKSLH
jgi:hypothetical protein